MKKIKDYNQLESDIIALKEYVSEFYFLTSDISNSIDNVLTEMNDLLLGIKNGRLVLPYKRLRLMSTYRATDGAFDGNVEFENLIYKVQEDIYSIRKLVVVLEKPWFYFHKKYENINWIFPNLDCKSGHIKCIEYQAEDILIITFPNGYEIDLGFIDNEYIITITKDGDWKNIVEEQRIKLRSVVEEKMQNLIYKYESL